MDRQEDAGEVVLMPWYYMDRNTIKPKVRLNTDAVDVLEVPIKPDPGTPVMLRNRITRDYSIPVKEIDRRKEVAPWLSSS
jgi:hypothetical protein